MGKHKAIRENCGFAAIADRFFIIGIDILSDYDYNKTSHDNSRM